MTLQAPAVLRIHPGDNVAVALRTLEEGETVACEDVTVTVRETIPAAHKVAIAALPEGASVIKYGHPIGAATQRIPEGAWVHVHNVRTRLAEEAVYHYAPGMYDSAPPSAPETFQGFRRADGRCGIRNELWIIPTVGCVNGIATALARELGPELVRGGLEGIHAFPHPYGCSQLGDDHDTTKRLLAGLARHPNAGGVLVLGLGCENNTMAAFKEAVGAVDPARVRFLVSQEVDDEYAAARACLVELAQRAQQDQREPLPVSALRIGLKCGGSDAYSGITANPVLGRLAERASGQGGTVIMTEVPEMFGAEQLLMDRCATKTVFAQCVDMVTSFKEYYRSHGQPVYENPSPGNKDGGITTLAEKSLGCVQKAGHCTVSAVLDYGVEAVCPGLNLCHGPGNDMVSLTVLAAAGAQLILFTTGRGTPFGGPVPTLKIASNSDLARRKPHWIDFDAGAALSGLSLDALAEDLWRKVIETASGAATRNEAGGFREIALFKRGVTL